VQEKIHVLAQPCGDLIGVNSVEDVARAGSGTERNYKKDAEGAGQQSAIGMDCQAKQAFHELIRKPCAHRAMQQPLSSARTNYKRRNVFYIDERVEIFSASEIGKVDDIVSRSRDFASHFHSRSQVQFDGFSSAALKNAGYSRSGLQSSFFLSEQVGIGDCWNEHCERN